MKVPLFNQALDPLVVIGASAGGPAALAVILSALPAEFPASVIVVQHLDEQFAAGLAQWLQTHSPMPVRLARDGCSLIGGTVLVAATNHHLILTSTSKLRYDPEPVDVVYRPSVDVFFESVVRHWPGRAVGVLLTGMGRDGAKGLKALRDAGYHTIAQDEASSAVYGMPKAAAALQAATEILPLTQIGASLRSRFHQTHPRKR